MIEFEINCIHMCTGLLETHDCSDAHVYTYMCTHVRAHTHTLVLTHLEYKSHTAHKVAQLVCISSSNDITSRSFVFHCLGGATKTSPSCLSWATLDMFSVTKCLVTDWQANILTGHLPVSFHFRYITVILQHNYTSQFSIIPSAFLYASSYVPLP